MYYAVDPIYHEGAAGVRVPADVTLAWPQDMSEAAFARYFGFICWLTVLGTGLGMESVAWQWLVRGIDSSWAHGEGLEMVWFAVQSLFPVRWYARSRSTPSVAEASLQSSTRTPRNPH